jgi:hypothetical protein
LIFIEGLSKGRRKRASVTTGQLQGAIGANVMLAATMYRRPHNFGDALAKYKLHMPRRLCVNLRLDYPHVSAISSRAKT